MHTFRASPDSISGKAVVIACPLELAELYQQRILSFGLTATIEKD